MIFYIIEGVIAYATADLLTGLYHWATDRGWSLPSQNQIFQQHHDPLERMVLDLRPAIFGLPVVFIALYWNSLFCFILGWSIAFCQFAHYYAHDPRRRLI